MAETYTNKVVLGNGTVLIDISTDTIEKTDVINKKTFHDKAGAPQTGTCTYDMDTSDATALASEILTGKTAGVGGQMVTGTMVNNGEQVSTISKKDQTVTIKNGFHDGSGKVSIDPDEQAKLIGDNILEGVTILGVKGTRKPASGVKIESAKSVVPSFTAQTITPSTGYDAMSQVNVSAITVTQTLNSAGGYTVTVG